MRLPVLGIMLDDVTALVSWLIYERSDTVEQRLIDIYRHMQLPVTYAK